MTIVDPIKGRFQFSSENEAEAQKIIAKYPVGRQASAVLPLLEMAQRQNDNWLPRAAMDYVADYLQMPHVKVYEVATFYSMFNLKPVGKHFVEICTTTPCWLKGSEQIVDACKAHLGVGLGETTADGDFTIVEVECLGACVNAPMIQVGHNYYEDLTPETMTGILNDLKAGRAPKPGSQTRKYGSMAPSGPTTLKAQAEMVGLQVKES